MPSLCPPARDPLPLSPPPNCPGVIVSLLILHFVIFTYADHTFSPVKNLKICFVTLFLPRPSKLVPYKMVFGVKYIKIFRYDIDRLDIPFHFIKCIIQHAVLLRFLSSDDT